MTSLESAIHMMETVRARNQKNFERCPEEKIQNDPEYTKLYQAYWGCNIQLENILDLLQMMNLVEPDIAEKQIPKRVIYKNECSMPCPPDCGTEEEDEYEDVPHCPNCGETLQTLPNDSYCRKCGQKIDWKNKI